MSDEDQKVVDRALTSRDPAAFGDVVRRHQSAVRQFLRHLARGDAALADDLAQETFVRAFQSLGTFRGTSSLSTWLLGIAYNQWRNARRRRRPETTLEHLDQEVSSVATTATSDLRADLDAALQSLGPDERLAVHLAYHQGLTHPEISAITGWPLGTTKSHVLRGRDKLRELLSAWSHRP